MPKEKHDPNLSLDDIFSRIGKRDGDQGKEIGIPFKFLDSYTIEDRNIFFGREKEVEEIFRKFYSGRLILVYGRSGTGKSSIINCGLVSKIPEEDIFTINIRCGRSPYKNFISGIKKYSKEAEGSPNELLENIFFEHSKPITLIFDQFEEIFILSNQEERKKLASALSDILSSRLKINVVLVIREEFFANLTEIEALIPGLYDNRIRIERMSKPAALRAITEPCKVCNVEIEDGLPQEILDHLSVQTNELELTWLQILMDKLYKKAVEQDPDKPFIRHEDLVKLGRLGNVLGDFLDEQLQQMDSGDQGEAVLKTMISNDGTKKQVTLTDISDSLQATGLNLDKSQIKRILRYLISVRIITDQDEEGYYELRHDAIASRIYERMSAVEKEQAEIISFLDNSFRAYEKRKVLLSKDDLQYIAVYENRLILNNRLKEFIQASKKEVNRSRRRRRNAALAAVLAIIVILSGFTIWAANERSKAVRHSVIAEDQKNEALKANTEAENARILALEEKARALANEEIAIEQQMIAEEQKQEAVVANRKTEVARNQALEEKNKAEANERMALNAKQESENAKNEAVRANNEAKFYLYQFNGKELANTSLMIQEDKMLKALLSISAYDLVSHSYNEYSVEGAIRSYDNKILESLQRAYVEYQSDSLIAGEFWAIGFKNEKIAYSNKIGQLFISALKTQIPEKLPELVTENTIDLATQSLVRSLAFSPSSEIIACGTLDGNVELIDPSDTEGTVQNTLYNHNNKRVLHLAFVTGKDWLVSSSDDMTIHVWDIKQQRTVSQLYLNEAVQKFVVINQDHLVFTNSGGQILDWDLNDVGSNPKVLFTNERAQSFQSITYDAIHKLLVTSSYGEIMVFEFDPDNTGQMKPENFTAKHKAVIRRMEFSPDHNWLVSASQDAIMLWNLKQLERNNIDKMVPIVIENNSMIFSLAFDTESKYLFWGDNRLLHIYPLDIEDTYSKLKRITQGKELSEQEWNYYVKGEVERPAEK